MKKKILMSLGVAVIIVASITFGAYAASGIKLWINGNEIKTDVQIVDGSSYVPLRVVSDELGAEILWDGKKRTITISGKVPQLPVDGVYKADSLAFYDVQVEDGSFGWKISTEVKNIGTKEIQGSNFTAVFYGEDGKRIGTAMGNVSNIGVSDVKTSSLITSDDLSGWATIKFQIDLSY